MNGLSDDVFGRRPEPLLLGSLLLLLIAPLVLHFVLLRDAPNLILGARIHQHVRLGTLLVLGTLEQECLDLIGHIVYQHLYVLLLHLELLQLIFELAHLLLLFEYCVLLFLQELV